MSNDLLQSLSPAEILGLTIIGEARGEPIQGQVAVGSVIRNRLLSGDYQSYHDVCLEPKQFSCWNINDPNRSMLIELAEQLTNGQYVVDQYLKQCMFVATGIVDWKIIDNTRGATHYMTNHLFDSKIVSWAENAKNINIIGHQTFFNV